jgi:DNA-binding transcriptional LysR family regulator
MDRYEVLNVYVRVVDAGSLSAAARTIPMSLATVSRHIAALEAHFGARLLRRTTRNLAITEEGRIVYERAKAILANFEELGSALSAGRQELAGRLRISAPSLLGRLVIAPLLPRFLAQHRSLAIDLLLVDRVVNLVEEGLDLAVRVGHLPDSSLIARKLDDIQMIVCAAPGYLARHGVPQTPDDLRHHDCLVFSDAPGPVDWRFQMDGASVRVSVTGRLWANNLDTLVAASVDGAGIVRAPAWQVVGEIDASRLRPVLPRYALPATPVNVLFEGTRLTSPRIRTFVDYLAEHWQKAKGATRGVAESL